MRVRISVVMASALVLGASMNASALRGAATRVTLGSPFSTGCEQAPTAAAYPGAEVEPFVATDPNNSQHLIGVWQQDRFPNGGSRGLGTATSNDGGATWTTVTPPTFSRCTGGTATNGGDLERATDPWVSIGKDGSGASVAYQISDSFNDTNTTNAILVSRSLDGGAAWQKPVTVLRESGARDVTFAFSDKESITADRTRPCYAYAIWDRLVGPAGNSNASASAFEHASGYRGPTWFSRTTDCGVSWEPARLIFDPGQIDQTIPNQIAVLSNGTLINTFDLIYNQKNAQGLRGENIAVQRSTDAGATWGPAIIVAKAQSIGVTFGATPLRTGDNIPDIAVLGNRVVLGWQDSRFSTGAHDDAVVADSTDGGLTWAAPVKVSAGSLPAFNVAVEFTANGRLGVGYHELAVDGGVTRWLATNAKGSVSPLAASVLSGGSANVITNAPFARGLFLGDYQGLTASGNNFVSFYVNPNTTGPNDTDVFAAIS